MAGSMLRSISRHTLAAWPSDQRLLLACQSRATFSKVLSAACSCCLISSFLALGLMPSASRRRISSRFSRALASVIRGYAPSAALLSLPSKRYLRYQRLDPLGLIRRYSPWPFVSLYSFSRGYAVRAATSVIGMIWGSKVYRSEVTPILTPNYVGCQRMCPDGFGPKKKPFGFNFRELWTIPDVLVYLNGAEGRTRTGTPFDG